MVYVAREPVVVAHSRMLLEGARLPEAVEAYKSTQNQVGCAMWRPQGVGDMSDDPTVNSLLCAGVGRKP